MRRRLRRVPRHPRRRGGGGLGRLPDGALREAGRRKVVPGRPEPLHPRHGEDVRLGRRRRVHLQGTPTSRGRGLCNPPSDRVPLRPRLAPAHQGPRVPLRKLPLRSDGGDRRRGGALACGGGGARGYYEEAPPSGQGRPRRHVPADDHRGVLRRRRGLQGDSSELSKPDAAVAVLRRRRRVAVGDDVVDVDPRIDALRLEESVVLGA
mmetsp:Transcript_35545/g.113618  ORF Transcript_35545/g.113618 Transcript_35545/m.113618 type:complete len:207 (+) Transcript_35545:1711-2331(+)